MTLGERVAAARLPSCLFRSRERLGDGSGNERGMEPGTKEGWSRERQEGKTGNTSLWDAYDRENGIVYHGEDLGHGLQGQDSFEQLL